MNGFNFKVLHLAIVLAFAAVQSVSAQSDDKPEKINTVLDREQTKRNVPDVEPPAPHRPNQAVSNAWAPHPHPAQNRHCDCHECQKGCSAGCGSRVVDLKSRIGSLPGRVCGMAKRLRPALGFAVEEVQYGANAGTPSFGYVSHGPWYNGEVFGPFNSKHRQSRRHTVPTEGCRSANSGSFHGGCGCRDCQTHVGGLDNVMWSDDHDVDFENGYPLEDALGALPGANPH